MSVSGSPPFSWSFGTNLDGDWFTSTVFCEAMQALTNRADYVSVSISDWSAYQHDGAVIQNLGQTPDDLDLDTYKAWQHTNHIVDLRIALEGVCEEYYRTAYEQYTIETLLNAAVGQSDYLHTIEEIQAQHEFDPNDMEEILKCVDLLFQPAQVYLFPSAIAYIDSGRPDINFDGYGIDSDRGADTLVDAISSGQGNHLYVASTTGFTAGDFVSINGGLGNNGSKAISYIFTGDYFHTYLDLGTTHYVDETVELLGTPQYGKYASEYRMLLWFDEADIPPWVSFPVAGAQLHVNPYGTKSFYSETGAVASVYGLTEAWASTTVTWNNQPSRSAALAGATMSRNLMSTPYESQVPWTITNVFNNSTYRTNGIMIGQEVGSQGNCSFICHGMEAIDSLKPRLLITL